ncbi:MAG: T9SS type A sorting domain-containing protein [Cyclobacteriaceae bacterium]
MKTIFALLVIFYSITFCQDSHAQGWMAVIDLDFNHDLYAFEKITNATFTYSGVTETGSSETSNLQLIFYGAGPVTGDMDLTINGLALEPYYPEEPYSEPIAATYSGNFRELCGRGFFENNGESTHEQIYIWIEFYPRLEIADFNNNCDELSFATTTCSDVFLWEVSETINGNYTVIAGKNKSVITITRNELVNLGFSDPYGRKYFRVTGRRGTTSQIQPVDIYYPPPGGLVSITSPKCHNGADGTVTVDIISADPSVINDFVVTLFPLIPKGQVRQVAVNDGFVAAFMGLPAGTYSIRIENNSKKETLGACQVDMDVEPLKNPSPVSIASFELSDYNGYAIKCNGGSDGNLKVNPIGGTGIYAAYEWSAGVSTTDLAENLPAGIYEVRVQDSNGCWSDLQSQKLIAPEQLTVSLISTGGKNGFDVSCTDKTDGMLETILSGGVPEYTFDWSNGTTRHDLSNIGAGIYEVTITDANGCAETEFATLLAPSPIDFSIVEITGIICPGEHSGVLEVQSVANAIGLVYYSWSSGGSGNEIANQPAGSYAASVSDDQGCVTTKHHMLSESSAWTVDIMVISDYNGTSIRCHGDHSAELAAIVMDGERNMTPAELYTWYKDGDEFTSGATLSSQAGLAAGQYKAEITYRNFCKAEKTIVLTEPDPVIVTISNERNYNGFPISCYGKADGGIRAFGAGGTGNAYEYSWGSGETDPLLNNISSGSYIVTARDVNGCEGKAEKILEEPEPVKAVISVLSNYHGQPLSCVDASDARLRGLATGGAPPFAYQWNSGHTTQELIDIGAGHYFLTATDANGCTSETDKILLEPDPVEANISGSSGYHGYGVSCYGASDGYLLSTGSGGTGRYDFMWERTSHAEPLYENLPGGTYTVIVKDQNGCTGFTQGSITEPEPLVLEVSAFKNVSCENSTDGEIQLAATGGAGDYTFSASGEGWQAERLLTGLGAGTYQPIAMDVNGCQQSIMQTIAGPAPVSIHFNDIEPALCGESRGKVSAIVTGGTGSYRYEWKDSEQQIISEQAWLRDVPSGIFTLKVLDDQLCEAIKSVGITATDGPGVNVSSVLPASCHDAADGRAVLMAEGNGPFTFIWEDGQVTAEALNLRKGDHLVEITDANNCTVVESVIITAPDSIQVELVEKTEPGCYGNCNGKLEVSGKGGNGSYRFAWGDFAGSEATNLCGGGYEVMITDEKGCEARKTFSLIEPDPLHVKLASAESPVCMDGCDARIEVEASGGTGSLQYRWVTGSDKPEISGICAGTYSITVSDDHQCTTTESFTVANPAGNVLDLGGSVVLCTGQMHILDAGSFWKSYTWGSNTGFKSSERRVTIYDGGMYWLEAVSSEGCVAQDTFFLETSADLLNARFLMTSEAMVRDTVVMIDISWPIPERVVWNLPPEMVRLHDFGDIVYGKFEHAGHYNISMEATLGECRDKIIKRITILSGDTPSMEQGRLGHEPFVKQFALYPNPNDGVFDVAVEFIEESALTLTVWSVLTGKKIGHIKDSGEASYLKHVDLGPLSAGTYTLRLDYENGAKHIRFIVR